MKPLDSSYVMDETVTACDFIYLHYPSSDTWMTTLFGFKPSTGRTVEIGLTEELEFNLRNTELAQIGPIVYLFKGSA